MSEENKGGRVISVSATGTLMPKAASILGGLSTPSEDPKLKKRLNDFEESLDFLFERLKACEDKVESILEILQKDNQK